MGTFIISTRGNGDYQFKLRAVNNETILSSEGYNAKAGCQNGIESVRKNAADEKCYDRLTATNGKFYFNLKSVNGQIIATSELYESEENREIGIAAVRENAPAAIVEDQTV